MIDRRALLSKEHSFHCFDVLPTAADTVHCHSARIPWLTCVTDYVRTEHGSVIILSSARKIMCRGSSQFYNVDYNVYQIL